jgi:uncharacterized RDD family membrane protein YckC
MTNLNDVIKIDTPENVTFDYDVAGIGSRFLAALVDTGIILLLQIVVFAVFFLLLSTEYALIENAMSWALAAIGLISFILLWGYYVFFEFLWNGQSPGKRLIGLRVIRVDGTPISESESIIRNLVRLIDFMPMAYGVGVVTMFINSNSRRVGDLAAGTVVVHDRAMKGLHELSSVNPGTLSTLGSENELPEGFPIEKLTQHELQVIEELFIRWSELSNRRVLAHHVLSSIIKRLDIPAESIQMERADKILAAIYKISHARSSE